jgi:hypothetical protein
MRQIAAAYQVVDVADLAAGIARTRRGSDASLLSSTEPGTTVTSPRIKQQT